MKRKVSIVTVTYNASQFVEQTIASVLPQTFTDYEFVFIDGKSSDNTLQIIESYRERFEAKGIPYRVKSEPDKGIYDAMNKGSRTAEGEWVLMLNAGDLLVGPNTLAEVFNQDLRDADILVGDVVLQDGPYYKVSKAGPLESITYDMPFCHQGIFVKQSVLEEYGFDTRFKLAADYNQLLRCYLDGKVFRYVEKLISVYDVSGVSERNFRRTLTEQKQAREQYGQKTTKPVWYVMLMRRRAQLIKRVMPSVSRSEGRGWYQDLEKLLKNL